MGAVKLSWGLVCLGNRSGQGREQECRHVSTFPTRDQGKGRLTGPPGGPIAWKDFNGGCSCGYLDEKKEGGEEGDTLASSKTKKENRQTRSRPPGRHQTPNRQTKHTRHTDTQHRQSPRLRLKLLVLRLLLSFHVHSSHLFFLDLDHLPCPGHWLGRRGASTGSVKTVAVSHAVHAMGGWGNGLRRTAGFVRLSSLTDSRWQRGGGAEGVAREADCFFGGS